MQAPGPKLLEAPAWNVVEGNQGRLLNVESSLERGRSGQPALMHQRPAQGHDNTSQTQTSWWMPRIMNWSKNQRVESDKENDKQGNSGCFKALSSGMTCYTSIDAQYMSPQKG